MLTIASGHIILPHQKVHNFHILPCSHSQIVQYLFNVNHTQWEKLFTMFFSDCRIVLVTKLFKSIRVVHYTRDSRITHFKMRNHFRKNISEIKALFSCSKKVLYLITFATIVLNVLIHLKSPLASLCTPRS